MLFRHLLDFPAKNSIISIPLFATTASEGVVVCDDGIPSKSNIVEEK